MFRAEEFGRRLREHRKAAKMTQAHVASMAGIAPTALRGLELAKGDYEVGRFVLERLCRALGLKGNEALELYFLAGLAPSFVAERMFRDFATFRAVCSAALPVHERVPYLTDVELTALALAEPGALAYLMEDDG